MSVINHESEHKVNAGEQTSSESSSESSSSSDSSSSTIWLFFRFLEMAFVIASAAVLAALEMADSVAGFAVFSGFPAFECFPAQHKSTILWIYS